MKKSSSFVVFGATVVLLYIGINTTPPLFEFYRRQFGVTPDELALLYSLYAVGTVVALPICGSASDWFGRTKIITAGVLCNAAGALLLAGGSEFQLLLVGRVLQGISVAAISGPALAAL